MIIYDNLATSMTKYMIVLAIVLGFFSISTLVVLSSRINMDRRK